MKILLLLDLKQFGKILIMYTMLIFMVTLTIHPVAGWGILFFWAKLERDIWRDNIAKGIPEFYRSLPEKNLFPDEKNILFYAISLFEIIIWMTATFMQESISGQKLFGKTVSYINFAMLEIIISSIYHILWVVINLKCLDNIKNIKVLNIYYSAMAIIIFILIKLGIVTKIYSNVLAPKVDMLCALCVGTIFCVGLSFLVGRKCFEKSEVK